MQTANIQIGAKGFQKVPVEERFWSKVDIQGEDECWPWIASADRNGRGQFWLEGRRHRSPRIAWALHHGIPFPEDKLACHSCDNPPCCNPKHIWPGTMSENIADAFQKGRVNTAQLSSLKNANRDKTHCKSGHEFTPENTRIDKSGWRSCRTCMRSHRANYEVRSNRRGRAALTQPTGDFT